MWDYNKFYSNKECLSKIRVVHCPGETTSKAFTQTPKIKDIFKMKYYTYSFNNNFLGVTNFHTFITYASRKGNYYTIELTGILELTPETAKKINNDYKKIIISHRRQFHKALYLDTAYRMLLSGLIDRFKNRCKNTLPVTVGILRELRLRDNKLVRVK